VGIEGSKAAGGVFFDVYPPDLRALRVEGATSR
jgi:hypothetical protein